MRFQEIRFLLFFCSGVYSPDYDNCNNVQYVNKQPTRLGNGDFGSGRDLNHWPPPHDSSSGGDSVYRLSAIPSVSFRSNSFTICRPCPMLVQKMSKPGHGDSDGSGISTSTSLPDTGITRHATVTDSFLPWATHQQLWYLYETCRWHPRQQLCLALWLDCRLVCYWPRHHTELQQEGLQISNCSMV